MYLLHMTGRHKEQNVISLQRNKLLSAVVKVYKKFKSFYIFSLIVLLKSFLSLILNELKHPAYFFYKPF